MLERTRTCVLVICLAGAPFGWTPVAHSQEKSEPAAAEQAAELSKEEKLAASAQTLMETIRQQRVELRELDKTYQGSKGEEKAILWSQIRDKREALGKNLEDLIKRIGDLEEAGLDTSQPEQLARELLTSSATDLQKSITAAEKRVIELREKRGSVSPEELEGLDKELAERSEAMDEDLAALLDVTGLMESQGIDSRAQLEFLDTTLKARAERLSGVLQFLTKEHASIAKTSPGASDEEKQAQAAKLAGLDERIKAAADQLSATVEVMKARELETAAYKQLLFESTGEITQDIFETEVAFGLLQGWIESGRDWVIENGPRWLFKIIVFVLILVAFKFLAGIVKRLMRKTLSSSKIDLTQLLENQIVSFTGKAVMFLGLLVALSQLGIELGPLLAGLGIAGFIIGFALQDTLSNFAAGMMILIYRPYDVGDAVEAGGVMGSVKAMNLVSTTIATWDNQKMVVPNSKIWGDVIRNITAEPH
jgi:small conductance mechanosensitive channel